MAFFNLMLCNVVESYQHFRATCCRCFQGGRGSYILHSWDRASLMYLSITNKLQSYTMIFITINALHVSGGSSANHQELKTAYTASGICRAFTASYRLRE
jgi:hypothetical protein